MKILYVGLLLLPLVACDGDKKMSGGVQQASADVKAPEPEPVQSEENIEKDPVPEPAPEPVCDKAKTGLTTAKILSKGISTAGAAQSIKYELSIVNCNGSAVPIKDATIFFDVNAILSDLTSTSEYVISDSADKVVAKGKMKSVQGSDLFGNTGAYAHWRTDNVSFEVAVEKLYLEIQLSAIKITPVKKGDTEIPSYLKIGDTEPVTANLSVLD